MSDRTDRIDRAADGDAALRRALDRERAAREQAERLLEWKSRDLYEANSALEAHQDHLKSLVHEKTVALNDKISELKHLRDTLRRDRDAARAESDAKSLLFAKLSHEIRTPLNGIIGMLNLVPDAESPADQQRLLLLAEKSSRSLKAILSNVIDFAKLEQGLAALEASAFDLPNLLCDIVDTHRAVGVAADQSLDLKVVADTDHLIIGDAGRIRQILDNFLSNAVKYGGSGPILVSLDARRDPAPDTLTGPGHAVVDITVTDSGAPLDPHIAAKIFEPYIRAQHDPDTRMGDGAGLGLAICRELADLMDAHVWCQPGTEGTGNSFGLHMRLPLGSPRTSMPRRSAGDQRSGARDLVHSGPKPTALVVEDVPTNQLVLGRYLEALNFRVEYASNGREALEIAGLTRFDMVFMDIAMPEMDGLEATRRLRATKGYRTTPIIGVSAHTSPEDISEMRSAGMNDSLPKPIDRRRFEDLVALRMATHDTLTSSDMTAGRGETARPRRDDSARPDHPDHPDHQDHLDLIADIPDAIRDAYVQDTTGALNRFQAAVGDGDRAAAKRALHQLKSLLGTFGHPGFDDIRRWHDDFDSYDAADLADFAGHLQAMTF